MPHSARYEVSTQLQDNMLRQYFFDVLLWPRLRPRPLTLIAFIAMIGGVFVIGPAVRPWLIVIVATVFFVITVLWVKTYFTLRAQGRAGLKIMEHPRVEITLDEEAIIYSSSTGTRRHTWSKIERIIETKDFVILMQGTLPLLMLPKSGFDPEGLAFLKDIRNGASGAHSK